MVRRKSALLASRTVPLWSEQVLPRVMDVALDTAATRRLRRLALSAARGVVVELGYGSGTNLRLYPPAVESVLAVEPSAVARRLAAAKEGASAIPVRHVGLDGAALPLGDGCADTVVSTFTLCTIPDLDAALHEISRVLRPGGELLFLEHGLSERATTARWQRRLTRVQQRAFGGCHLERAIDVRIRSAGFTVPRLTRVAVPALRPLGALYLGSATPRAADGA